MFGVPDIHKVVRFVWFTRDTEIAETDLLISLKGIVKINNTFLKNILCLPEWNFISYPYVAYTFRVLNSAIRRICENEAKTQTKKK